MGSDLGIVAALDPRPVVHVLLGAAIAAVDTLSAGRSADSTVDGSDLYPAITCCPRSPDCCPPCPGIGVRTEPDSPPFALIVRMNELWR
jgi:hypothetical protein